jgi:sterol 3beta-glucosyltransferase
MNDDDSEPPSPSGTNLHRSLPPRLNTLTRKSIQGGHVDPAPEDHPTNVFDFLVAILNKESWFAVKVTDAMAEAHRLHLVEGATPTKMVLDVGGYDCLAADDEHETSSVDDEQPEDDDDDHGKPVMVVEASKAQKAAMAARLFGLREDEGIYRE